MYDKVISELRSSDRIGADDIVVVCMDSTTKGALLGGAIGAAIAASKASHYVMVANGNSLAVFDVDKKTGEYLGTGSKFEKEDVISAVVRGGLGSFSILLKTNSEKHTFSTSNKFRGYVQKDQIAKLRELFKSGYNNGE